MNTPEIVGYPIDERGYTDTRGAAAYIGLHPSKLAKDRSRGVGIVFVRFGGAVRYSFAAIDAHASANVYTSTRASAA